MRLLIVTAMATIAVCGCSNQTAPTSAESQSKNQRTTPAGEKNDELSPADAKVLIPEAASIANADFEALSKSPDPTKIESQTLSLILFSLNPYEQGKNNPAALDDFKYLTERFPTPSDIADSMWQSKSKGYATMIQPEFITDCKCNTKSGTATGTIAFEANGLYSGNVEFTAGLKDGDWRVEEFRLPNYGLRTVRGSDGKWKKSPSPKPRSRKPKI